MAPDEGPRGFLNIDNGGDTNFIEKFKKLSQGNNKNSLRKETEIIQKLFFFE